MASQYGRYPDEPIETNDHFTITLIAMNYTTENEILFDDFAMLENRLGAGALNITSVNTNCDCTSYSSTSNDEDRDPDSITPLALTTS